MRLRSGFAVAVSWLLIAAMPRAADEAWELVEETMSTSGAPRSTPVARFASLEMCQARAVELSASRDGSPDPSVSDGTRRLGFMCVPAGSSERAPAQR
jgi:hypothetical protein